MSISRRTFLKGAGTAAAAATLQPLGRVLGAPALIQADKKLTIGINADAIGLDPHHVSGGIVNNRWHSFLFDYLVAQDVKGKPVPMLATEWKMDGTTWKFTLRPNVKFHDGTIMTARDVAYSLNRLLGYYPNPRPSQSRAQFAAYIKKVEVTGDLEVTMTTPNPDPVLPIRLASTSASIMPEDYVERKGFDAVQKEPLGAGPYKMVSYAPGDRMVLERHTDYWAGAPVANQLTIRIISENATRIAALRTGEVDLITSVPPDLLSQVSGNARIDQVQLFNYMLIRFNTVKGVLTNVGLRKALSLAIDRTSIVKDLWGGRVTVLNDYWLPEELGYDSSRKPFAFDLEAAKKELTAAGYAGEEIEFSAPTAYYNNGRLVTDAINEMWQVLGVKVKYELQDTAAWVEKLLAGNQTSSPQSFGTQGEAATAGPATVWVPKAPLTQYYKPSDEYQKLVQDASSSNDPAFREKNYRAMTAILDRDVPIAPLYRSVEFYGVRKDITWEPHPQFFIDLRPGKFNF